MVESYLAPRAVFWAAQPAISLALWFGADPRRDPCAFFGEDGIVGFDAVFFQ